MKLHFDRKGGGEVVVQVDGKDFTTVDYIKMIKEVKKDGKIEADFSEQISQDEKDSVGAMLKEINRINQKQEEAEPNIEYPEQDINPDDIPF